MHPQLSPPGESAANVDLIPHNQLYMQLILKKAKHRMLRRQWGQPGGARTFTVQQVL